MPPARGYDIGGASFHFLEHATMAKQQSRKAPVLSQFTVLIGGQAYKASAQALTGDALTNAERDAVQAAKEATGAEAAIATAKVNAEAQGWKTAASVAVVYSAYRVSGMDDGGAYQALASRAEKSPGLLIRAGVNKSSAQRFAAAGRAIAAGVVRKDGETLKAYAARVGGIAERAPRQANPSAEKAKAGESLLRHIGEARAAAGILGDKRLIDLLDSATERGKVLANEASAAYAAEKASRAK
jgi:hypothetical protein